MGCGGGCVWGWGVGVGWGGGGGGGGVSEGVGGGGETRGAAPARGTAVMLDLPALSQACGWARRRGALGSRSCYPPESAGPWAAACLTEGALMSSVSSTKAAVHMAMSLFTRSASAPGGMGGRRGSAPTATDS